MQVGFTGLLGLLFIGLKLAGYITWSWLWVLSPLWIGGCLDHRSRRRHRLRSMGCS